MPNNIGAFGENFPYTNQHDMNMDWIIKIAKDFLDQYTTLKTMIETGETDLTNIINEGLTDLESKATELENLLQAWYDTHSNDIALELANAVSSFNTQAQQIVQNVILSIPADYSTLATNAIQQRGVRQNEGDTILTDFDNALPNKVYTCTSTVGISHTPTEYAGTLITLNGDSNFTSGNSQLYFASNGQLFTRIKWGASGGTWSAWKSLFDTLNPTDVITAIGERQNEGGTVLTDFDSAIANRIYTFTSMVGVSNAPTSNAGTLVTMNGDTDYSNGQSQIFISDAKELFYRIKWNNAWTKWVQSNPFDAQGFYASIDLFEKFCIIGDSFASGYICTPTNPDGTNNWYLSWGRMIARRHGTTCHLQARGGYSTYDFTNVNDSEYSIRGLGKLITDTTTGNADGLYILNMGINDSNRNKTFGDKQGGLAYLGSAQDINLSNPSLNANSFWGNYGKIIQTIQTNSPTSRIVIATFCRIPTEGTAEAYDAYNNAIKEIATYFNIPCIVLEDDIFFTSPYYLNNMVGYHPTAPQYAGFSYAMERLISKCMLSYYTYFRTWTGM